MIRRDAPFSNTVLLPITPTLSYSPSTGNVVRGQVLGALQELQYYLLQQDDLSDDSNTTAIFAHYGDSVVGLYVGGQFQKRLLAATLLQQVFGFVKQDGQFDSLIVQACGPTTPSDFTVGLVVDTRGLKAFSAAQNALRQWSGAQCVSGVGVSRSFEQVLLPMAPDNAGILRKLSADSSNHTGSRNTSASLYPRARLGHSHLHRRADCRTTKVEAGDGCWAVANRCGVSEANLSRYNGGGNFCTTLQPNQQVCCSEGTLPSNGPPQNSDGTCSTKKVDGGDSCASLATKCGVSGADFTKFNSGTTNLCSTLRVGQLVCCSTGKLPDIRPKPNPDGSCATYTVKQDDWCDKIAAAHGLTLVQLESFNKGTWGFTGCTNLFVDIKLCVSSGTPPMPEPISNANCGPQKPNTVAPSDRSLASLASLNPCPLNACCNIWGQCGTTAEFCTVTGKGGPGTVAPGTNGCISNCGMDIVNNDKPPAQFRRVGYFEAWNKERLCLHMDVEKIDKSRFTHIHFAFVDITPTFEVDTSKVQEQFDKFVKLQGVQRIVAFGGWEASTNPSSYWIFREGVKTANRVKLATNIANFIRQFNLDGVDFDWEYPAAPDIPGIPAGDAVDGPLYRDFLALMRARIGSGKSLSIAAPASHWYLKGMPIEAISRTVDYIVYMTYDLHGQWDAGNPWSSPGCPGGNCLRSHINMTETLNALSMVTKAGVPSAKLLIGVTSYGRSFQMSDPNCSGPQCTFTGDHKESFAMKGWCTGTAGYISDAEINGIISSGRFTGVRKFTDDTESNIVVFNGNNWVAYMDAANKASRIERYRGLNFGGISDWAVDLESFSPLDRGHPGVFFEHRPPDGGQFEKLSWWNMTCGHGAVGETDKLTKQERWDALDTNTAWKWVIDAWKNERAINPNRLPFTSFISDRFNGPSRMQCQLFDGANNCRQTLTCDVFKGSVHKPTGPAAYLITNAIISLHQGCSSLSLSFATNPSASVTLRLRD
ncbi:chitinase [Colletotrichum truncatum]|uniref:Chitinase n=1 Tax=Colletotrichum truncatum TaxID=5467 RepID=A0ACC3ZHC3_COLTU